MNLFKRLLTHSAKKISTANKERDEKNLFWARTEIKTCLRELKSSTKGLTHFEARRRLFKYGRNEVARELQRHWLILLLNNIRDPLCILLLALAAISFFTHDLKSTTIISVMVVVSVVLRFSQELRADTAARKLNQMVRTTTRVIRDGKVKDISIHLLVPGDIVQLSAGDMIPADLRLITSKDLFVNQAALTGESLPVEKHAQTATAQTATPLEAENLCFLGTNVEIGTAAALVIATGQQTTLGGIAQSLAQTEPESNFDQGIKKFTWLIMKFILVMVPAVFLLNGFFKGIWLEAFFFSLAVAVGLAPEMLPMIVAVNLSKGALDMSRKKVIIKHLNSIQNFGAMDILCTDKTGTLTEGRVILEKYLDFTGQENPNILKYAYINSYFQTGLKNLLDVAVLKHAEVGHELKIKSEYEKIDEMPFDFSRRRMSVVARGPDKQNILICKGAVEEIIKQCRHVAVDGQTIPFAEARHRFKENIEDELNQEGFRVVAVAYKKITGDKTRFSVADESDLTLLGFLAFLDPPKDTAEKSIKLLREYGINVKILTGDNELVTRHICGQVGLAAENILLGGEVEKMSDDELGRAVEKFQVFAKLTPNDKERIVKILRANKHAVGFLGDGINDAPALRAADIGISVNGAADIAKESSDIILLEKNLLVLHDGVKDGRKTFGNVVKYIQMAASSNFGNMFSVLGASIFLPFLPMLPLQILVNNLLYDMSQTAIPTDRVDEEYLKKPRQWDIGNIKKFILYIGPVSSLFDYASFFVMLLVFNAWFNPALFQTGWFVESLISQTLIIHIIRTNKIPFIQSRASWPLTLATLAVVAIGVYLPFSPLANALGFTALPALYWPILFVMIIAYFVLTQLAKKYFLRRHAA